jgi:hypothetical protein
VTSARKITASRTNARASTGPKTAPGRARAARNAFRHGLSLPVQSDPALSQEVEALARKIAGTDADADIQHLACRVAEAAVDLRRVRHARHRHLLEALSDPYYESRDATRKKVTLMCAILRRDGYRTPELESYLTATPQGPEKLALILSQEAKKLSAFDRYEQRAWCQFKLAVQSIDDRQPRIVVKFDYISQVA